MNSSTMQEDFAGLAADSEHFQQFQDKHVYITGATGQIGWYLVRLFSFLIATGRLKCHLSAHVRNRKRLDEKFPDYAALRCNFIIDEKAETFLSQTPCHFVIHCASMASPKHFAGSPVQVMEANAIVTHGLLEQIRIHNPVCRFVYLSTTGVTGFIPDEQRPSTETQFGPLSCTDLGNCYLESKRFAELLALAYWQQYGIPVLIVRPSITYGPGFDLDDGRSYADFVRSLVLKEPIKLTSDGSAIRNFLYITDFISGLLLTINNASPGSIFNVASPYPISILELATLLNESTFGTSLGPVAHLPKEESTMTRVNFKSTNASVDQLIRLGWRQKVSHLDGFKKTIQHYLEQQL